MAEAGFEPQDSHLHFVFREEQILMLHFCSFPGCICGGNRSSSQSSHAAQILCKSLTPACLLPSPAEGQVPLSASQLLGPWGLLAGLRPCRYYLNLLLALLTPGCVFLRSFALACQAPLVNFQNSLGVQDSSSNRNVFTICHGDGLGLYSPSGDKMILSAHPSSSLFGNSKRLVKMHEARDTIDKLKALEENPLVDSGVDWRKPSCPERDRVQE